MKNENTQEKIISEELLSEDLDSEPDLDDLPV